MSAISELDESNSALRLLITLYQRQKPMMQFELYEEMKKRFSIGRGSTETAIQTCMKLGLLTRETKRLGKNPMPSLFHQLTEKGKKAAKILLELQKALT